MADYIEREAAVKIAERYGLSHGSVLGRHSGIADCIASEISGLPAADVVKVVRCGNCKSSEPIPENSGFCEGDWLHCRKWRGELTKNVWHPKEKRWKDWSITTPEGFCDDGDTRDENEEDG